MSTYMVVDGNGDELCDGLSEDAYESAAQAWANRLGVTVYAYEDSDDPDVDAEAFEPAREVAS